MKMYLAQIGGRRMWHLLGLLMLTTLPTRAQSMDDLVKDCEALIEATDATRSNDVQWHRGTMMSNVDSNSWPDSIRGLDPKEVFISKNSTMIITTTGVLQQTTGFFVQRPGSSNATWALVTGTWTNINSLMKMKLVTENVYRFEGLDAK